jgi:hypothetical protein
MKEVYELPHKGKCQKELKCPPCFLAEENYISLPIDIKSIKWSRKVQDLYLS